MAELRCHNSGGIYKRTSICDAGKQVKEILPVPRVTPEADFEAVDDNEENSNRVGADRNSDRYITIDDDSDSELAIIKGGSGGDSDRYRLTCYSPAISELQSEGRIAGSEDLRDVFVNFPPFVTVIMMTSLGNRRMGSQFFLTAVLISLSSLLRRASCWTGTKIKYRRGSTSIGWSDN